MLLPISLILIWMGLAVLLFYLFHGANKEIDELSERLQEALKEIKALQREVRSA